MYGRNFISCRWENLHYFKLVEGFFYPEDWGNSILRNVYTCLLNSTVSYSSNCNLSKTDVLSFVSTSLSSLLGAISCLICLVITLVPAVNGCVEAVHWWKREWNNLLPTILHTHVWDSISMIPFGLLHSIRLSNWIHIQTFRFHDVSLACVPQPRHAKPLTPRVLYNFVLF